MVKRFFAAHNPYGSDTSIGYANTWEVHVFGDKRSRDKFIDEGNLSTRAIAERDIGKYIDRPQAFSGMHWSIVPGVSDIDGYIGRVDINRDGERVFSKDGICSTTAPASLRLSQAGASFSSTRRQY